MPGETDTATGGDGWARVSAVLDQMTAERERALRRGEAAFMPTLREVRHEVVHRFGRGVSFRDLGPFITRYIAENEVARRLRVRSQPSPEPAEGENGNTLPMRVRRSVDRALGAMETARDALARVLAEEVEAETEALLRRIGQLDADAAELRRLLVDRDELLAAADEAEERAEIARRAAEDAQERLRQILEAESELRAKVADGQARVVEAETRRGQVEGQAASAISDLSARLAAAITTAQAATDEADRIRQELATIRSEAQATADRAHKANAELTAQLAASNARADAAEAEAGRERKGRERAEEKLTAGSVRPAEPEPWPPIRLEDDPERTPEEDTALPAGWEELEIEAGEVLERLLPPPWENPRCCGWICSNN